jgi:MFS family permease
VNPLRRNPQFQLVWVGSVFSFLGVEVADVGYPLAILALTGSPGWAAAFGMTQALASLLSGFPAGALVDRLDRRRVLLVTEGARLAVTGSVAVALAVHHLSLGHLIGVAAVLGAAQPTGSAARMLIVRAVVPPVQLTAALTREEIRTNGAQLAGPPLGGLLYGLAQALPFLFTAVSFAASWVLGLFLRLPAGGAPAAGRPAAPAGGGMFAGLATLWRNPTLRVATLLCTAINLVSAPLALMTVVVLRDQAVPPWQIGTAMSGLAVGGLAGAALIGPLHRRLRPGVLLIAVAAVEVPILAALALPLGPWWIAAVLFCAKLGVPALRVLVDVLIFRQIPDEQRGRAIAAVMTLFGLGSPVGIAAAGLLLQFGSPATAILAVAGTLAPAVLYSACRRDLRRAPWPGASRIGQESRSAGR